jgi:hypothetical protein
MTIVFEFPSVYGTFRDALNLPNGHGLSEDQLTAMKQTRFDDWLSAIVAASNAPQNVISEIPEAS